MRRNTRHQIESDLRTSLEEQFAGFRNQRQSSRARCPAELRILVLKAIDANYPKGLVAEAAGIDKTTINNWQREAGEDQRRTKVTRASSKRELRIVGRQEEGAANPDQPTGVATLRIGLDITIDLPVTALTGSFLATLRAASGGAS